MKLKIAVIATATKSIFMMKKTRLALLSHRALHSSQSGAVNSTDWCRPKTMRNRNRSALTSRLCVTSVDPHLAHSHGLSMFVTVDLYRNLMMCVGNSQTNV
jgi:hypothetical protein